MPKSLIIYGVDLHILFTSSLVLLCCGDITNTGVVASVGKHSVS